MDASVGDPGPLSRLLQELADASGDEALEAWTNELSPGDRVGRMGRHQESKEAVDQLEREHPDEPTIIAGARAGRGDVDGAFESLEVAVRTRHSRLWTSMVRAADLGQMGRSLVVP